MYLHDSFLACEIPTVRNLALNVSLDAPYDTTRPFYGTFADTKRFACDIFTNQSEPRLLYFRCPEGQ